MMLAFAFLCGRRNSVRRYRRRAHVCLEQDPTRWHLVRLLYMAWLAGWIVAENVLDERRVDERR